VTKINILAIFNNILAIFRFYWRIPKNIGENFILLANSKIYWRIPFYRKIHSEKGGLKGRPSPIQLKNPALRPILPI